MISQCHGIFIDQSIFRNFSLEIGQFSLHEHASVKMKHCGLTKGVNMSTSCRHVDISPCLWLQSVTAVPVGIWLRDKLKLKIDRSVKTPWQAYGAVAGLVDGISALWEKFSSKPGFSFFAKSCTMLHELCFLYFKPYSYPYSNLPEEGLHRLRSCRVKTSLKILRYWPAFTVANHHAGLILRRKLGATILLGLVSTV